MELSEKLVKLRKAKGISQLRLAELMNVSRQAVSRWEGGLALPSTDNLKYLGKLYDVSLEYLLYDDAPEPAHVELMQRKSRRKKIVVLVLCSIIPLFTVVLAVKYSDMDLSTKMEPVLGGWYSLVYLYGLGMRPMSWVCGGMMAGVLTGKETGKRRVYQAVLWLGVAFVVVYVVIAALHFSGLTRSFMALMWLVERPALFLLPGILTGLGLRGVGWV